MVKQVLDFRGVPVNDGDTVTILEFRKPGTSDAMYQSEAVALIGKQVKVKFVDFNEGTAWIDTGSRMRFSGRYLMIVSSGLGGLVQRYRKEDHGR